MFEAGTRRRLGTRLGVVLVAIVAIGSLGMSFALAAPPFTISITEPVTIADLTVTLSGTADSPSHTAHHIVIDWGDGSTNDDIQLGDGPGPWNWGPIDHTYAEAGTYTITTTIIHASDTGNDQGQSATDSTVVEVVDPCPEEGCTEPDPCVEDPTLPECQEPTDDGGEETPPPGVETPPPADEPDVLGTVKKPLAKTASPATTALWAAIIVLMIGATVRYCAVEPATVVAAAPQREDLVAKSLDLVNRMVRSRGK
jgi:hypothetical protein